MGGNKSTLLCSRLIGETFLYYEFTHYHLLSATGTDYPVSRDAVSYYIEHDRLAVIPKDEDKLSYSRFGNSLYVVRPYCTGESAKSRKDSPESVTIWSRWFKSRQR